MGECPNSLVPYLRIRILSEFRDCKAKETPQLLIYHEAVLEYFQELKRGKSDLLVVVISTRRHQFKAVLRHYASSIESLDSCYA